LIEDGDSIAINAETCEINLLISDEEWEVRRAKWFKPEPYTKIGTLAKYAKLVSTASEGAVTDKYLD